LRPSPSGASLPRSRHGGRVDVHSARVLLPILFNFGVRFWSCRDSSLANKNRTPPPLGAPYRYREIPTATWRALENTPPISMQK
jgi:hypothetical protein